MSKDRNEKAVVTNRKAFNDSHIEEKLESDQIDLNKRFNIVQMSGWKKLLFGVGTGGVLVFALFALVETGGWLFLWYPGLFNKLPQDSWLRHAFVAYYFLHDMHPIQFDPNCATYDTELLYTLRPGTCRFANREFDTTFRVSHQGFRIGATEEKPPRIVVIGDSHAMGWGIGEGKTFAELLSVKLDVGVDNLAISSYGTARELMALRRVDRKIWEIIIVVYCPNDRGENEQFASQDSLPIYTEESYQRIVALNLQDKQYHPFGLIRFMLRRLAYRHGPQHWLEARNETVEADLFVRLLTHAQFAYLFVGRDVIVMEIDGRRRNTDRFIQEVAKRYSASSVYDNSRSFTIMDTNRILDQDDYFPLDRHLNELGHAKIAEAIYERLGDEWKSR